MKVILLQDVKKVGQKGSIVEVAPGYAQNVLISKKLAVPATDASLKTAKAAAAAQAERRAMDEGMSRIILAKLVGQTVLVAAKASEKGSLFKAIGPADIVAAIEKEFKIALPESAITLEEPIKKKGEYHIPLSHLGASASVNLVVI